MILISRHHDVTLFAVNSSELTLLFMLCVVFLGHFDLTPVVGALNDGVVTLSLMLLEFRIGYDCVTAFIGVVTGAFQLG